MQEYSRLELEILGALTAIAPVTPTSENVARMRRQKWQARSRCIDAGHGMGTLLEFRAAAQSESEAFVRRFVGPRAILPDNLPRGVRQLYALGLAIAAILASLTALPSPAGAVCGLVLGWYLYGGANVAFARMLPTVACHAGVLSANLECGVLDLFPPDSSRQRDYRWSYDRQLKRLHRRLGPAPWLTGD